MMSPFNSPAQQIENKAICTPDGANRSKFVFCATLTLTQHRANRCAPPVLWWFPSLTLSLVLILRKKTAAWALQDTSDLISRSRSYSADAIRLQRSICTDPSTPEAARYGGICVVLWQFEAARAVWCNKRGTAFIDRLNHSRPRFCPASSRSRYVATC